MISVSVIVPVYNTKDYLSGCIDSIINQTYTNLELILVDDGSTDGSGAICDAYAAKDSRIKVIHKKNGGLSSARNAGIDNASGEFLMFVDGDDYLTENAVEILLQTQQEANCDIVQFDYEETKQAYHTQMNTQKIISFTTRDTRIMFDRLYALGGSGASACTKLYRREIFDTLRFQEGILHEDEQLIPFVLQKAKSITYISNKLYCYCIRQGSIIQSKFQEKKLVIFDILTQRMQILQHLGYQDLAEKERGRYFSTLIYFWADAKKTGNTQACKKLQKKLKNFLKENNPKVSGYMSLIKYLCKIYPGFIATYYYLKKIRGK